MFFCPVKIIFASQALQKAKPELQNLGKRAFVVTGKSSAKASGALRDCQLILSEFGIDYAVYDGISENPSLESVIQGKELFKASSCDFIVAIGGGSPIDAAKAISLAAANDLQKNELYDTQRFAKAYPLVAIPTTSGTGSEATQYSVLTDYETRRKAGLGHSLAFPRLAILDPVYTLSSPSNVTLNTALDALSHLLEGIYSKQRTPLVLPLIYKGIANLMEYLPLVLNEPDNLLAREKLMQASLYGGMVIAQGSTTLQHSAGYPLTTDYGVPHGLANAMVMEAVMELYYPAIGSDLESLFSAVNTTRKGFLTWLNSLPFPRTLPLSDAFIVEAIPQIMASRNMALNPFPVSEYQVRLILEKVRTH